MVVDSNKTILKDRILWYDGTSSVTPDKVTTLGAMICNSDSNSWFVTELTNDIKQYNALVEPNQQFKVKQTVAENHVSWLIPEEFLTLEVEEHIVQLLVKERTKQGWDDATMTKYADRIWKEIDLYTDLGLLDVLRTLIYIINTLQYNNIVWGVGRGSSVSSYVLYLIGVHDVDSVQYDLDITEFLRSPNTRRTTWVKE